MSIAPAALTFSGLMTKVGYFILYWSSFEQALGEAIIEARRQLGEDSDTVRGGLKERLDTWVDLMVKLPENADRAEVAREMSEQALKLRDARNLIVHGLAGGSAFPPDGGPSHIRCAVGGFEEPTGEVVCYTMDDLENFIQGADACRRACSDLKCFNHRI